MEPGDGIASSAEVLAAAEIAARRFIAADFDALALAKGSVISASLFGALAGSGALPFPRAAFEAAIRAGGKGIEGSLRAFAAGYEAAVDGIPAPVEPPVVTESAPKGPPKLLAEWNRLTAQVAAMPAPVAEYALLGLRKVVDFQDIDYGSAYLGRVGAMLAKDSAAKAHALTREAAKYIANAMCYDDVIRVADLKTRAGRLDRIRTEMGVTDNHVLHLTEFMHPRAEEVVGMLPARLGAKVAASPKWMARLDRWFNKGRRVRTDSLSAYLMLYVMGGLKSRRLGNLRHAQEVAHMDRWLGVATGYLDKNYDLAVEVIKCRRLVKGYSDTHARGLSKFDKVLDGIARIANRADAPDWARRLREAALKDEEGKTLDGAMATIRSFA
jgi:indolepyruvate ferredoxin oxidoreductase beta subunit